MRQSNYVLALVAAAVLAGCGDSDNKVADIAKPSFARQVVFGDSLADSGSYAVGPIAAAGGGKFTVNGVVAGKPDLNGKIWVEALATTLGATGLPPVRSPFGRALRVCRRSARPSVSSAALRSA